MRRLVIVGFLALVLACGLLAQDTDYISNLQVLAEQGDASAQSTLGVRYDRGEGVPQDSTEAVKWFRLAAEQGNATAQSNQVDKYHMVIYDMVNRLTQDGGKA